ncbi:MAG: polyprenyl synthetase family protein, partial [Clostridia bacterium]|nr:polyprenyl synthetase family protein [Clostridia bacterium]
MKTIESRLQENAALVEQALRARTETVTSLALLGSDDALATLLRAEDYSLMAGGKRIRPTLAIECCRALGGDVEAALPFGCAVEMIHTYSLIHDDLPCMDNDDLRRGKPTNHKVFGEATAILAGDGLLTDAFSVAVANDRVSESARLAAVRILAAAAGSAGMVGGQVMDMEGETRRLPLDTLRALHARKTGAMIRASVQLGALAAGCEEGSAAWQALTLYADKIGLAFQVVDDVLDATADPALLGKSVGKDQNAQKTTFLSYYSVE